MKKTFDQTSLKIAKLITNNYSTSFSVGVFLLDPKLRPKIYALYSFVRLADEIVDSFEGYNQEELLQRFIQDYEQALSEKISLNPILNAFQIQVHQYDLHSLVAAFLRSMKMDLSKTNYKSTAEYQTYIYGSAEVVGLMCLKIFVNNDPEQYAELKPYAIKLGSAFQKINFLRDIKDDTQRLGRTYFPNVAKNGFTDREKQLILTEIRREFKEALIGIKRLPVNSRLGVYVAYKYYLCLYNKIKAKPSAQILSQRIRINNFKKFFILKQSLLEYYLGAL